MIELLFVPAVAAGWLLAFLSMILTKRHLLSVDVEWSRWVVTGNASSTAFTMLGMSSLVKGSAGLRRLGVVSLWQLQVVCACVSLVALLWLVWWHLLLHGSVNYGEFTLGLTCFPGERKWWRVYIWLHLLRWQNRKQQRVHTWLHVLLRVPHCETSDEMICSCQCCFNSTLTLFNNLNLI